MKSILKKAGAALLSAAIAATSLGSFNLGRADAADEHPQKAIATNQSHYNLAKLLQYSMTFYDANMCGTDVEGKSLISWRGNCHTYDAEVPLQPMDEKENGTNLSQEFIDKNKAYLDPDGDGKVDVSGGFHDAGDHVEFGMPENYTAATLGWGYYEFRDSYVKLGLDKHIETLLRHVNDYLMRCTFTDDDGNLIAFCYQVGDGDIDHDYWESPEADTMPRPAYFLTAQKPQIDYTSSAAASLLINYLNFKDTDPDYAKKSLDKAKSLFNFTDKAIKEKNGDSAALLSDNGDGPKQYYSSNKWEDDYCWAAAWMFEITQDKSYLDNAEKFMDYYAPDGWCYCWNDMWSGAITMWAIIQQQHPEFDLATDYRTAVGKSSYEEIDWWKSIEKALKKWETGYNTPAGYSFMSVWGSARYNTAMQFMCLIHDKYTNGGKPGPDSEWAMGQMNYLLGDNPLNRSYVCGYGDNCVKYPHHRAASGLTSAEDTRPQKHTLYGALVGGPDGKDEHHDITADYTYNEVTSDYNAAFVGAAAGLYAYFGTDDMKVEENFPPVEKNAEGDGGNAFWVEAFAHDVPASGGAGTTEISFKVMTDSSKAKTDVSVRYFFNTSEMSNPSLAQARELYDQASVEGTLKDGTPADGIISEIKKYDKLEDTYYVEISFPGYPIANSGKKYQFSVGLYYGDNWDPSNDYSYDGLPVLEKSDMFGNGNEKQTDKMCVYSNGVLIGGVEPDGTKPADTKPDVTTTAEPKVTTTTTTTTKIKTTTKSETTTTTVTTTTAPKVSSTNSPNNTDNRDTYYGDVNVDGVKNISDVILLNKKILGSADLGKQSIVNADVDLDGSLTANDSVSIMKNLINLIDLPVKA